MTTQRKSTTRSTRSRKKTTPDDAETLKDTQEVAQMHQEALGATATPGASVYQSSQFDVGPNPNVIRHMANPPKDLVEAKKASDEAFYNRKTEPKEEKPEEPTSGEPKEEPASE